MSSDKKTPKTDAMEDIGPKLSQLPPPTWSGFLGWLEYVSLDFPPPSIQPSVDSPESGKAAPSGKTFDSGLSDQTLAVPNWDAARRQWLVQVFQLLSKYSEGNTNTTEQQLLLELIRKHEGALNSPD